jgi:hypothetical protein
MYMGAARNTQEVAYGPEVTVSEPYFTFLWELATTTNTTVNTYVEAFRCVLF